MNIKILIYLLILPFSMWSISSLNIEKLFKKNSLNQIRIFYLLTSLSLTYLVSNFILDFYKITSL